MAVLWVLEGYQKGFERQLGSYVDEMEGIRNRYEDAGSGMSAYAGDSVVNNSDIYLKKRRAAISKNLEEADNLKAKTEKYVQSVISADRILAGSIHKKSYDFYQKTGIGPQKDNAWSRGWNTIKTTAEDFWRDAKGTAGRIVKDIKDFYEEKKYIINIVTDVLMVAGAIALFVLAGPGIIGIICMIGAAYALSKALYETAADCMALEAWMNDDEAKAEDLAARTLRGDAVKAGEWLDQKMGTDFFESSVKVVLAGLEVCQFVCEVVTIVNVVKTCFNLQGLKSLDLRNMTRRSWAQSINYAKMTNWGTGRFLSVNNWVKFALTITGFSVASDAPNLTTTMSSIGENGGKNVSRMKELISVSNGGDGHFTTLESKGDALGKTIGQIILQ